jgi:isopenicillin N synthase-like dioxygenase
MMRITPEALPTTTNNNWPKKQDGAAAKQRVAQQLHAACRDVGFVYVVGHQVPQPDADAVLREARAWFELPVSV